MKKLPLIIIVSLILLVVVSGILDSGDMHQLTDDKESHNRLPYKSPFTSEESHQEGDSFIVVSSSVEEMAYLEDNILKSEDMVERLNKVITGMEAEGKDVTELEPIVSNYSSSVSEARDYLTLAENASTDVDKEAYLTSSRESIIRANSELKPIFKEVKAYLPGPLSLTPNNSLVANGSGIAILSGDLNVEFFLSDGRFSVVDFSGDVVIETESDFDREENPEAVPADMTDPHEVMSYTNVTGNVSLSGSVYTVAMISDDITLRATGVGEAELVGNGTYYLENDTVNKTSWVKPIFESD